MKSISVINHWKDYKIDPRYFIILFLGAFVAAGQIYLGFYQKWDVVIVSVLCTIITELIIVRLKYKKWTFPLSAFITGLGVSLLLSSNLLIVYSATAILSICLKFFLRFKGAHVFNPNNLGVVIMLVLLPQYAVSTPKQWTNGYTIMVLIMLLGFVVVFIAKRLDVVLTYLSGYVIFSLCRHFLLGTPFFLALGPLLGASLQLFTFFMITDPKTTPASRKGRIVYGISIALIDAIYRAYTIPNPQFYALFTVSLLLLPTERLILSRKKQKQLQLT